MSALATPSIPKWPFVIGDLLLLGAGYFIYSQSVRPLAIGELGLAVLCVLSGAFLMALPFILEYRAVTKVAEAAAMESVVSQIRNLEGVATQVSTATARWNTAQEHADKTAAAAKSIADQMAAELKGFTDLMQRLNDSEKSHLRLEVEKLRRFEGDWLQIVVRMLDHTFALHQAAVRAGQPNVIEQVTQFQAACREAARRIGLVGFGAEPDEPFDPDRHQVLKEEPQPGENSTILQTLAPGFTFQGRLLRPALVRVHPTAPANPEPVPSGETEGA